MSLRIKNYMMLKIIVYAKNKRVHLGKYMTSDECVSKTQMKDVTV